MSPRLLASVRNREEAAVALSAGADIIDLKDPEGGALQALSPALCAEVVHHVAGRVPVSATIGADPECFQGLTQQMQQAGVDLIKVGLRLQQPTAVAALAALLQAVDHHRVGVVPVWLIEDGIPDAACLQSLRGAWGTMLDTADKAAGALPERVPAARLRAFLDSARDCGLVTGLAGSLGAKDIPPLLRMGPDYLGFRGALCATGRSSHIRAEQVRRLVACCTRQHIGATMGEKEARRRQVTDVTVA